MIKTPFPVVIIAGGLATRLHPVTKTLPKSLIEIHGEPFIAHQLRLLHQNHIRQVIICLGYLGEQIMDFVGDGSRFGLSVNYSFDGPTLLGTAGAVKKALTLLPDQFFVLNGDSYLPCDYTAVQNTFEKSLCLGLMTVFRNNKQWDTSNVEYANQMIIDYDKKNLNSRMLHIDYGLEIFHQSAFDQVPENQAYDLALLFQDLLKMKQLAAHEIPTRFYEIGSFNGIQDLENYLKQKSPIDS